MLDYKYESVKPTTIVKTFGNVIFKKVIHFTKNKLSVPLFSKNKNKNMVKPRNKE